MRVEFLRRVGNTPRGTVRELPGATAVRLAGRGYVRPVGEPEGQETVPGPERPDPADRKGVWVEYAVSSGVPREKAERLTKAQLQEV